MPLAPDRKTAETHQIEDIFRANGFSDVECYRAHAEAIRLRVIDAQFECKTREQREKLIVPVLMQVPNHLREHIHMWILMSYIDIDRAHANTEFENPGRDVQTKSSLEERVEVLEKFMGHWHAAISAHTEVPATNG